MSEYNHIQATDFTVSVDNSISEGVRDTSNLEVGQREYNFSCEIELDIEQTVVCNHCNEVASVPDADFLSFMDTDAHCHTCGMPLGMNRETVGVE